MDCSVYLIHGLTVGVTGQQGMLTPPRHLIPPLVYPGPRICLTLVFVFYLGLTILITVRYLCLYIVAGVLTVTCKDSIS